MQDLAGCSDRAAAVPFASDRTHLTRLCRFPSLLPLAAPCCLLFAAAVAALRSSALSDARADEPPRSLLLQFGAFGPKGL